MVPQALQQSVTLPPPGVGGVMKVPGPPGGAAAYYRKALGREKIRDALDTLAKVEVPRSAPSPAPRRERRVWPAPRLSGIKDDPEASDPLAMWIRREAGV